MVEWRKIKYRGMIGKRVVTVKIAFADEQTTPPYMQFREYYDNNHRVDSHFFNDGDIRAMRSVVSQGLVGAWDRKDIFLVSKESRRFPHPSQAFLWDIDPYFKKRLQYAQNVNGEGSYRAILENSFYIPKTLFTGLNEGKSFGKFPYTYEADANSVEKPLEDVRESPELMTLLENISELNFSLKEFAPVTNRNFKHKYGMFISYIR